MMKKFSPIKSPNDAKNYVVLHLKNELKILVVSDAECDKAAASLSVGVGSMNDPNDIPGLAHLCEHLLSFEVNEKPGTKPFNAFIAEHGGMFNAFTARDQTNFHFDVDPKAFEIALKRFAEFFTTIPKLSEQDVDKEISIVDAEHLSKVNKDAWRKMAVDASTSKIGHPFQKFSTGNKTTLSEIPKKNGINVLDAAREFRSTYYVANIMALVVYSKDSLKNLEDLCARLFSDIKTDKAINLPSWDEWPYGPEELQKRIDVVSVSDIKEFFLVFPMANMRPFYKTFPHGYLTRVIGYRGPGSLYSYLSDRQWMENSYMNASIPARGFGELSVGFQLTKEGMKHIDEIILLSFQYIKMIREKGPQEMFWREIQEVMHLKFLHQDKEIPIDFVQRLSNLLHVYPAVDILSAGSLITEYNPSLIQKFIDYMNPENCRIMTVCRANGERKVTFSDDHWYGAKYSVTKFTDDEIQAWKFCELSDYFFLPAKNKFLPTNFELKHTKKSDNMPSKKLSWSPEMILNNSLCKAWFLKDTEFQLAKGVIRLEIFSPLSVVDPISYNLNQIWFLTLKNILGDKFYEATIAGSYHGVKPTLHGVEITVSGFSDKLLVLMEEMVTSIIKSVINMNSTWEKHFFTARDRYATTLANLNNLPPSSIANHYLSLLLREKRFSYEELQDAIADTTTKNLCHYMKGFFFRTYFEWMIYGNFTQKEAENLVQTCSEHVKNQFKTQPLLPSQNVRFREVCLTPGIEFLFRKSLPMSGNACAVLIQVGVLDMRNSLTVEVIDQIIFEPLFTQLRNQEHIGYIVRSYVRKSNGCQGFLIFLQGDKQPSTMSERVFAVLKSIENRIDGMTPAEFTQHKSAVRVRKVEQPKSMLMLLNKLWNNEIYSRRYDFNRIDKEVEMLDNVTKAEVLRFFKKHISSSERQILQIHLHSSHAPQTENCVQKPPGPPSINACKSRDNGETQSDTQIIISDITLWKMQMSLYPTNIHRQ